MAVQEVFFLPAAGGQRFCIFHPPRGSVARGAVLYVHPFAEEMNKSRRMAALFSRTLSESRSGFNEASFHLSLQGEMPHS